MFAFWKICRALFSCNTRFEIRLFALLPTYCTHDWNSCFMMSYFVFNLSNISYTMDILLNRAHIQSDKIKITTFIIKILNAIHFWMFSDSVVLLAEQRPSEPANQLFTSFLDKTDQNHFQKKIVILDTESYI